MEMNSRSEIYGREIHLPTFASLDRHQEEINRVESAILDNLSWQVGNTDLQQSNNLTEQSLHDASLSVTEDQSVGPSLKVGGVNIDLLSVNVRQGGMELGHEQDKVTHVNVVAEAVNNEEKVAPVLSRFDAQWSGLRFFFLIILLHQVFGFSFLLFGSILGLLFFVLLSFFLGFLFF